MSKLIGRDKNGLQIRQYSFYPFRNQRKWKTVKAASKTEADILAAEWMKSFQQSPDTATGLTFSDIWPKLEIKCKADRDGKHTIANYHSVWRNFFERFLPMKYPDVKDMQAVRLKAKAIFEQYKIWVVVECGRADGWGSELIKLKPMFSKLNEIGLCDDEVMKTLKLFKKPKRHKRLYKELSKDQKVKILLYIKEDRPDYYGIAYLIVRYGWRRSQSITLKTSNIQWDGLNITAICCEPQDTKTKEPFIFRQIDPELANIIKDYYLKAKAHNSKWLFPNSRNNKHNSDHFGRYIKSITKKVIGIEIKPHDFRHSFITEMKAMGYSDEDIILFTGHKDARSLQTYSHASRAKVSQIVADTRLFDKQAKGV